MNTSTRWHKPMVELLDDPAFLAHVAQQAGVSLRTARRSIPPLVARGRLDLSPGGPCTCEACRKEGTPCIPPKPDAGK